MVCAAKAGPDANVRGWISKSQSPSFNVRSTRLIATCSLLPEKGIINYFRCQKTLIPFKLFKMCPKSKKRRGGGEGGKKAKKKKKSHVIRGGSQGRFQTLTLMQQLVPMQSAQC